MYNDPVVWFFSTRVPIALLNSMDLNSILEFVPGIFIMCLPE